MQRYKALFLLSLFYPFGAFIGALRNIWDRKYQGIILIFSFWFGYTVFFETGDIIRYRDSFQPLLSYSFDDYIYLISHSLDEERKHIYIPFNLYHSKPDIFALTLGFMVSRFTENYRWFFALVSVTYTFFFLKFAQEIVSFSGKDNSKIWVLLYIFILTIVPFYVGVSGVRFWTALFLFMYMTVGYFRTGSFKNVLLAGVSIFFHYTFLFPSAVLLLVYFIRINQYVLKGLVLMSLIYFFLSSTSGVLDGVKTALEIFDDTAISASASEYATEDEVEYRNTLKSETNWYVQFRTDAIHYFFIIVFVLESFGFIKFDKSKLPNSLDLFHVLFFCIAMFSFGLGSIGRFVYIFYLISLLRLLFLYNDNSNNLIYKNLYLGLIPIVILHNLVILRSGFYLVDPILIIGNPLVFFITNSDVSLSELIVGH